MKVLITEDHPIVVKMLSNLIVEIYPDAIIKTATNTEDAAVLVKAYDLDLVISDLDFNGEKRFSIVELAKEYGIRCIVFSGHYNMAFIKKAAASGAIGFISKLGNLDDLKYALLNYKTIENYICSYCQNQNKPVVSNEIISPDITAIEEIILSNLLVQKPRKEIAKELKITSDSLNTYINRMTAKNDCNLLVLIHRYIVWKRSMK